VFILPAATSLSAELVRRQFEETDVPEPEPRLRRTRLALAAGLERVAHAVEPTDRGRRRLGSGAWQG
jgi:hypothetical protein